MKKFLLLYVAVVLFLLAWNIDDIWPMPERPVQDTTKVKKVVLPPKTRYDSLMHKQQDVNKSLDDILKEQKVQKSKNQEYKKVNE